MHLVTPPATAAETRPWVTLEVVAKHLGVHPNTVRKMLRNGRLPGRKLQNGPRSHWRFQLSAIDAAMRTREAATRYE